jgi:hypothetical protein
MAKPENKRKEHLESLQADQRRNLETECRLMMKYELRWSEGRSRTDREMRDKFARMVKDRLSELSVISMRLAEFDQTEVAHG